MNETIRCYDIERLLLTTVYTHFKIEDPRKNKLRKEYNIRISKYEGVSKGPTKLFGTSRNGQMEFSK